MWHRELGAGHRPVGSWPDDLAAVKPGDRCLLTDMAFSMVRDRCADLGLMVGDEVLCVKAGPSVMSLRRADGRVIRLEREYAWFIQVQPGAGAHFDSGAGAARRHRPTSEAGQLEELVRGHATMA